MKSTLALATLWTCALACACDGSAGFTADTDGGANADGALIALDLGVGARDGAVDERDGAADARDGAADARDGAVDELDAFLAEDALVRTDAFGGHDDAQVWHDAASHDASGAMDASTIEPDAATTEPDASAHDSATLEPDAAAHDAASHDASGAMDASTVEPDAATPEPDASAHDACVAQTYYLDGDGDGYGDAASPTAACSAPDGYVDNDEDCDDGDDSRHPSATDVCNNDVDEDCNHIDAFCAPCEEGSWDDDADPMTDCAPWRTCVAGEYVFFAGTPLLDRDCEACPSGFSTTDDAEDCTPWTECAPDQSVLADGTATTDRACANDCVYSTWSTWSVCTAQCGGGTTTSTRTIVRPAEEGGIQCDAESLTSTQSCNTQACVCTDFVDAVICVRSGCDWSGGACREAGIITECSQIDDETQCLASTLGCLWFGVCIPVDE